MKHTDYKLYRELKEIFYPSISRQNISNYKIVIKDNLIPINVFYPSKEVELNNIIIYITSGNNYNCDELAINTNNLVFGMDYNEEDYFNRYYDIIKYIYNNIEEYNISKNNITIMCDINNNSILEKIIMKLRENNDLIPNKEIFSSTTTDIKIDKNRLFLPSIGNYYNLYTKDQLYEVINKFLT